MKLLTTLILLIAMSQVSMAQSPADSSCSTRSIAGHWMFATGIGRQSLGAPFPEGKDLTAIGIFSADRFGNIAGKFDATLQDSFFLPDNTFTGSVVVNSDCTGTFVFVTSVGTARTDSIVVVNRREILGMTQDPANLWTYQMRRLSRGHGGHGDNDKDKE